MILIENNVVEKKFNFTLKKVKVNLVVPTFNLDLV